VLRILSACRDADVRASFYLTLDKAGQTMFFGEIPFRLPDWGLKAKIVSSEIELRPRSGNYD
jgi:hypothetical protein